jgi:hypothetical protein
MKEGGGTLMTGPRTLYLSSDKPMRLKVVMTNTMYTAMGDTNHMHNDIHTSLLLSIQTELEKLVSFDCHKPLSNG